MDRYLNNYKWALFLICIFLISGCGSGNDGDTTKATGPYIEEVYFFTENFEGESWIYQFGCKVHDDKYDIQSVIAKSVTTDDEFILSDEIYITGEWKLVTVKITGTPWLDQIEIIATNTNGDSSRVLTHILDNEQMLDYAENIVITGASLAPTISWDTVSDADRYRIRIYNSSDERIFDSDLVGSDFTATSYTVPSGVLTSGEDYYVRVISNDYEMEDGTWELENRSSNYASFSTAP